MFFGRIHWRIPSQVRASQSSAVQTDTLAFSSSSSSSSSFSRRCVDQKPIRGKKRRLLKSNPKKKEERRREGNWLKWRRRGRSFKIGTVRCSSAIMPLNTFWANSFIKNISPTKGDKNELSSCSQNWVWEAEFSENFPGAKKIGEEVVFLRLGPTDRPRSQFTFPPSFQPLIFCTALPSVSRFMGPFRTQSIG